VKGEIHRKVRWEKMKEGEVVKDTGAYREERGKSTRSHTLKKTPDGRPVGNRVQEKKPRSSLGVDTVTIRPGEKQPMEGRAGSTMRGGAQKIHPEGVSVPKPQRTPRIGGPGSKGLGAKIFLQGQGKKQDESCARTQ